MANPPPTDVRVVNAVDIGVRPKAHAAYRRTEITFNATTTASSIAASNVLVYEFVTVTNGSGQTCYIRSDGNDPTASDRQLANNQSITYNRVQPNQIHVMLAASTGNVWATCECAPDYVDG